MEKQLTNLCKGEGVNLPYVLDKLCERDREILGTRRMDFDHTPTIAEMRAKYGRDFDQSLVNNQAIRSHHRIQKRGYILGKNRSRMRWNGEIPVEISGNPRNPLYWEYFNPAMDKHERHKHRYEFLRKYQEFMLVDKL